MAAAAPPPAKKHHYYTPVVWDTATKKWQNIPRADKTGKELYKGDGRFKGTTHSQAAAKYANSQRCTTRKGSTLHMLRLGTRGTDVRSYRLDGYDIVAAPAIMVGVSTVRRAKLTTVTTLHKPETPAPKPPATKRQAGPSGAPKAGRKKSLKAK